MTKLKIHVRTVPVHILESTVVEAEQVQMIPNQCELNKT